MKIDQTPPISKKRNFLRQATLWGIGILAVILVVLSVSFLSALGRTIVAPSWVQSAISERINSASLQFEITFGQIEFTLDGDWGPQARVRDVTVKSQQDEEIISFSEATLRLALRPLMRGKLKPKTIEISGAFATLLRDIDGNMSLRGGSNLMALSKKAANLPALIEQLDTVFELSELSELNSAEIQALTLRYEDAKAQRVWVVDGGRIRLIRNRGVLELAADLALLSGGSSVATLEANYTSELGNKLAEFGLNISEVAAQDIALQSPALAWLSVLRAPISGALRSGVLVDGTLAPLSATLQIGEGVVQPTDAAKPIPFSSARSYLTYNPKLQIIDFDELSIESKWLTVSTEGQAFFSGLDGRGLGKLVGQFQLSSIAANPDDLYDEPLKFDAADMDFQLKLDPFVLKVGRMQVADQGKVLRLDGNLSADKDGWDFAANAQIDGIESDRLLTLWPNNLAIRTRDWINKNFIKGNLTDLDIALRGGDDQRVNTFVSFNYDSADVRFMKTMPPLKEASGQATLLSNRFVVTIDEGQIFAPQGGKVDVAGSAFIIPDVSLKGKVVGEVQLKTESTVTAALSLLNQPKLEVMDKAGLPVALADGSAVLEGDLTLPLRKGVKLNEIKYSATGMLASVKSLGLVPDKMISSDALQIAVSNSGVRIWGAGRIGAVPFDAEWSHAIGTENVSVSQVKGTIELSENLINEFNIGLPAGTFSGASSGEMVLKLAKGEAPALSLTSNLRGLGIKIAPLGWFKSEKAVGQLNLKGRLGTKPIVDLIELDSQGLTARGRITTLESGGFDKAEFSSVSVGNWLRAPILLTGQGKDKPLKIDVFGGTLDLRNAEFFKDGEQVGGAGSEFNLKLDKVQITDALALVDMRGAFTTKRGLNGKFTADLNGETQIQGQILPQNGRSAVMIKSNNAGGIFASAGLLKQARGGDLSLVLLPVGKDGGYDGKLYVQNTRITDAPAIAALLNALSVVGILEQMGGSGIHFQDVEADFHLTPSTIALINASAVGPSMGISMDGIYDVDTGTLDMRGVVSPLFFLNSVGNIFTRKGEGLIGFDYGLSGSAKSPIVSVNPLSVFTPGMFREVFRAPVPNVVN